ncbi:Putative oxidoreductase YceM [Granulosicoccus antarcticus IMCC3135]|uniref:Oxidoreductase YceM n=2 Tax=Granulosicoccus TaxID=437504 RepID=A0A2Z2P1J9_9GAMM|nr:Putative oxidoreductase YceM [Granulosicoccus antarcticus IMCC3135]
MQSLRQHWPLASAPRPIVIIGAGSIVSDAHLPAYGKAGYPVLGIYDPDQEKASQLAAQWDCQAFSTLAEATAEKSVVFDLAIPPAAIVGVLDQLPQGAAVLIQKPMGSDLAEATEILALCRAKDLQAAVNFQLRFSPMMLALQDAIDKGMLGEVLDFDAWLALDTPWGLWKFLEGLPRVEITLHSIHYLDLIRAVLGNPLGIHARTLGHPSSSMAQTRTSAILDYGDRVRCCLSINHDHAYGRRFQACEFRVCGSAGAAYVKLGVNLDYPHGEPDELWIKQGTDEWQQVSLTGEWFPDAFASRMSQLQRFLTGEDERLISNVEDSWQTMALVEAAYNSSAAPATPIAGLPE